MSLTIDKALPEDEGQYICVAENSGGRVETSCMVLVDGKCVCVCVFMLVRCVFLFVYPHLISVWSDFVFVWFFCSQI